MARCQSATGKSNFGSSGMAAVWRWTTGIYRATGQVIRLDMVLNVNQVEEKLKELLKSMEIRPTTA